MAMERTPRTTMAMSSSTRKVGNRSHFSNNHPYPNNNDTTLLSSDEDSLHSTDSCCIMKSPPLQDLSHNYNTNTSPPSPPNDATDSTLFPLLATQQNDEYPQQQQPQEEESEEEEQQQQAEQDYKKLYRLKYKAYIESILKKNQNHSVLREIQIQAKQNSTWIREQVTQMIQGSFLHMATHYHYHHHRQQQCTITAASEDDNAANDDGVDGNDILPNAACSKNEVQFFSSPIERVRQNKLSLLFDGKNDLNHKNSIYNNNNDTPSFSISSIQTKNTPLALSSSSSLFNTPSSINTPSPSFKNNNNNNNNDDDHSHFSMSSGERQKLRHQRVSVYLSSFTTSSSKRHKIKKSWRKRVATSSGKKGKNRKKKLIVEADYDHLKEEHNNDDDDNSHEQNVYKNVNHRDASFHSHSSTNDFLHSHNLMDTSLSPIFMQQEDDDDEEEEETQVEEYGDNMEMEQVVLRKGTLFYLRPLTVQQRIQGSTTTRHTTSTKQAYRRLNTTTTMNHINTPSDEMSLALSDNSPVHKETNQNKRKKNHHSKNTATKVIADSFFTTYEPQVQSKLILVSKWLLCRDLPSSSSASRSSSLQQQQQQQRVNQPSFCHTALILNISQLKHAMSLVLNTLAQHGTHKSPSLSSLDNKIPMIGQPISNNANIPGGTLIIVRSKEDLPFWEIAFREETGYSLWNHAIVPPKTRRRVVEIVTKCAGTHVVLTTIDCVKSKEVPILVDAVKGRPVNNSNGHDGDRKGNSSLQTQQQPWFSSRNIGIDKKKTKIKIYNNENSGNESMSSSDSDHDSLSSTSLSTNNQPVVKVLSVLHGIRWHRIIFVDTLDRTYLTQQGGVRYESATALHGSSRIILLMQSSENVETAVNKLKESRKQLIALARTMDLDPKRAAENVVGRYMLDLQNMNNCMNN